MENIVTTLLNSSDLVRFNVPKINTRLYRYEKGTLISKLIERVNLNIEYNNDEITIDYNKNFVDDFNNYITKKTKDITTSELYDMDTDKTNVYFNPENFTFNIVETINETLLGDKVKKEWFLNEDDAKNDYNIKLIEEMDKLKEKMV